MAPGSSEPSTAADTLSQEVPVDTSTPSFVGWSTQRKRIRHSKLHEKVRRAKQSQKKKDGKLERASESSVSTGNVEKTTGAEDPTPSPPTSPIPTPPPNSRPCPPSSLATQTSMRQQTPGELKARPHPGLPS
ncbi:hypothetical protein N7522_002496 [Penicillium canescens]|nr:hypothetical protein N7522_002496 [Penicillium canescens]